MTTKLTVQFPATDLSESTESINPAPRRHGSWRPIEVVGCLGIVLFFSGVTLAFVKALELGVPFALKVSAASQAPAQPFILTQR